MALAVDFLDAEDLHRLSDLTPIFPEDSENLVGVDTGVFITDITRVLGLLVENPFVDLNPAESGNFLDQLALLAIQLAASFRIDALQVGDLVTVLAQAICLVAASTVQSLDCAISTDQVEVVMCSCLRSQILERGVWVGGVQSCCQVTERVTF